MFLLRVGGCPKATTPVAGRADSPSGAYGFADRPDDDKVRTADYIILFYGNSHTAMHDLPGLVCNMIPFRFPGKTACAHYISVVFLEDVAANPVCRQEVEARPWKYIVLQASV